MFLIAVYKGRFGVCSFWSKLYKMFYLALAKKILIEIFCLKRRELTKIIFKCFFRTQGSFFLYILRKYIVIEKKNHSLWCIFFQTCISIDSSSPYPSRMADTSCRWKRTVEPSMIVVLMADLRERFSFMRNAVVLTSVSLCCGTFPLWIDSLIASIAPKIMESTAFLDSCAS